MTLLWMIPLTYSQQKQYIRSLQQEPAKNPRIIGGRDAIRNRFPAMVLLSDREMELTCGGTLISPTVVLTAAHCRS
jgi:secreted trypsin-like serine protease